jgi:hypothetical protein
MTIKSVEDMTLSQVPDLDRWIIWCWKQVPTIRVEGNLVDCFLVSIVMLEKSLAANVPDLNGSIWAATCNTSAIWVESNWVNNVLVVIKAFNHGSLSHVP